MGGGWGKAGLSRSLLWPRIWLFTRGSDARRCPAGCVVAEVKNVKQSCFAWLCLLGWFSSHLKGANTTMTQFEGCSILTFAGNLSNQWLCVVMSRHTGLQRREGKLPLCLVLEKDASESKSLSPPHGSRPRPLADYEVRDLSSSIAYQAGTLYRSVA